MEVDNRKFIMVLLAMLAPGYAAAAEESDQPTKWQRVEKPMSALLDDGWTIQQFSARDTDWQVSVTSRSGPMASSADSTAAWPRSFEAIFVLSKAGKHVLCLISDPTPGNATSRCRALN